MFFSKFLKVTLHTRVPENFPIGASGIFSPVLVLPPLFKTPEGVVVGFQTNINKIRVEK
jgi:hypothetical protein